MLTGGRLGGVLTKGWRGLAERIGYYAVGFRGSGGETCAKVLFPEVRMCAPRGESEAVLQVLILAIANFLPQIFKEF